MNVGQLIEPPVTAVPDRIALVAADGATTYRELESLVRRTASALVPPAWVPGTGWPWSTWPAPSRWPRSWPRPDWARRPPR